MADEHKISSSSSTSWDTMDDAPRIHPNYTRALLVCFALQTLGIWANLSYGNDWEKSPIWVNLLFWPFCLATIILGGMHMRYMVKDRKSAKYLVGGTIGVVTGALLYRWAYFTYFQPEMADQAGMGNGI